MVYRQSPSSIERREPQGDVLLHVDASGRPGAPGRPGAHGADGHGSGADGHPGGHAGAAAPGERGGEIGLVLRAEGAALAAVEGMRRFADGREHRVHEHVEIGEHGFIDVTARGGAGGRGGDGGAGGEGARGRAGSNATRYSSGGNGGQGGDGGAGGRGTSGANGGPGGSVVVRVDDADTHLLMLVRRGVEGGAGGAAGRHGRGGAGGPGGPGGSSHTWSETQHYTDSQGTSQTRTTFHSNPGGSSGPSGSPGPSGSGPLYAGREGAAGRFTLEVITAGGAMHYPARYHLMLAGLRIRTDDRDGVFEPGERVKVDRIRVRNVGAMPTPSQRAITLEVRDSKWCTALAREVLEVPRSVPAGAELEVPGTIEFELRDHAPLDPADPLAERERVSLRAHVPDVNRSFEGFEPDALAEPATMLVRFPVAASRLEGLVALAPGEVTRFRFAIRNQSSASLGANSARGRRVRVRLALHESELGDADAVLVDEQGRAVSMHGEGLVRELDRLEPGEDWLFEGAIGMREHAAAYRELRLRLTLEIGRIDMPDVLRVAQQRELRVRCVRTLGASATVDWLLVAHHRTSRAEIDAWEALAQRHQRALAVWDLSREGHLALEAPHGGGPSLIERMRGGLVVVLGYPMASPSGEVRGAEFLAPETLARAADAGVDVLLAGGSADLGALLAPAPGASGIAPADGEAALIERIAARGDEDRAFVEEAELHEIGFFFERATEARLAARAAALSSQLARRFPQRRFTVVWTPAPRGAGTWSPLHRYALGTLRVLARPGARSGMAHIAVADAVLSDPRFVASAECATALAVASGPDDQIDALAHALAAGDLERARVWASALLVGLASEQLAVMRQTRARAGLTRDAMRESLPRLVRLAHSSLLGAHAPDSPAADVIVELAAKLRFFADAQVNLWERIPGIAWARRAAALDALTESLVDALLDVQSSDEDARRVLHDRARVAEKALRAQCKSERAGSRREWTRAMVLGPIASEHVTTDDELLVGDRGDVVAHQAWEQRQRSARASARSRGALIEQVERERSELLLAVSCAELVGARLRVDAAELDSDEELDARADQQALST